ncbi:UNVERIFIED_CONTAM: putative late blight resistance proteinR1B-16 [Sesamum radiatum]|uniref:Late blight resistance proteinR1B-16 n=1 Tax=Sesamum radiatum TaxID=300843 RepID=A0AAW2VNA8_SESRA
MLLYFLVEILKQILDAESQHLLDHKKQQLESLLEKACSLQDFLEKSSGHTTGEAEQFLELRIRDVAYKGEDLIVPHLPSRTEGFLWQVKSMLQNLVSAFWTEQDLEEVIEEIDSITEEARKVKDASGAKDLRPKNSLPEGSAAQTASLEKLMVGFDDDLMQLKDRLTGQQSKLQMIPIVGMAGIGKTTLAKNIYQDPLIVYNFDIRAWITVSQEYYLREILLCLLGCTKEELTDKIRKESDEVLATRLYKNLKDDNNGSGIMLTTRHSNVADYVDSCSPHHQMRFLNDDESWKLLQEKLRLEENYPELEKIGMEIAKNCQGLPLTIAVIGGVLSKLDKRQDVWEHIAKNVSSVATSNDEQCLKILSLSYNYLPHHLKPCFLYMGVFPEDYEISVSKLIKLWAAEGFLKPIRSKSLELVAMEYLQDLIDRNLVIVRQQGSKGITKSCSIHDLLRDICVREGHKEKFLCVMKVTANTSLDVTNGGRRLIFHGNSKKDRASVCRANNSPSKPVSAACSFLCVGRFDTSPPIYFGHRLLRVLDVAQIEFSSFPEEVLDLFNLRYLALNIGRKLPPSISVLQNLLTLIVQFDKPYAFKLPPEICEMPQLRHIYFTGCMLPDPPSRHIGGATLLFPENLETLSVVRDLICTEDNLRRIQNLKKLAVEYQYATAAQQWSYFCLSNLDQLHKLENLKCRFGIYSSFKFNGSSMKLFLPKLTFPLNLKKFTLSGSCLPWEDMTLIGSLPKLEVLKLHNQAFKGEVWEPTEGEFLQLKYLKLDEMDLAHWRADDIHFPSLQRLILRRCRRLNEIPAGIGEITTLELIELDHCGHSVITSANNLKEEQESFGNLSLEVRIN